LFKEETVKKFAVFLVCLAVMASGAFALEKNAGGVILFNGGATYGNADFGIGRNLDWSLSRAGFGVFGFFGVSQFVELNFGFLYKNPDTFKVEGLGSDSVADIESVPALQLGVYGKYPIPVSDKIVIFPTGGVDLEITLSDDLWWHDIWLRAGAGLDYFFNEKMFLRSHLIYGLAVPVGGEPELGLKFGHGVLIKVGLGWMF
jgi:hypothetical protein